MTAAQTEEHEDDTAVSIPGSINIGGGGAVVRIYLDHGVDDFFHLLFVYTFMIQPS